MAINPYLVLDFAQNLGQQRPLTQLGAMGAQAVGAFKDAKDQKAYDTAFQAYREKPNQETGLALTQAAIPLGLGQETMLALQMYGQEPEADEENQKLRSLYNQTLDALQDDPTNTRLRSTLVTLTEELKNFDETKYILDNVLGVSGAEGTEGAFVDAPSYLIESYEAFRANPTDPDARTDLLAASSQAENYGYSGAVDTALKMFDLYDTTGEAPRAPIPDSYTQARLAWLSNPFDSTARANFLDKAQELRRRGYEDEVEAAEAQIAQFDKAEKENPEEFSRVQELLQRYGQTGNEDLAAEAELLAQGIGLDVSGSIQRYRGQIEARGQQQRMSEWNTALNTTVDKVIDGEEPSEAELVRLRNIGLNAGVEDSAEKMANSLSGYIAERRTERLTENLNSAERTLRRNPLNQDALDEVLDAASKLGLDWYEQARADAQQMRDAGEQELLRTEVQQSVQIISALENGNFDVAQDLAEQFAQAYEGSSMPDEAEGLRELALSIEEAVKEGNTDDILRQMILTTGASGPEGREALEPLFELRGDRRASVMDEANLMRIANDLTWGSQADQDRAIEDAEGMGYEIGSELMRLGSVVSRGGTPAELTAQLQSFRKEYDDRVDEYDTSLNSAAQIEALVESGLNTGALDQTLMDFYNIVSNPDAVVRQSDVARSEAAQAIWRRVENFPDKIEAGTTFTQETRQDMLDVVKEVERIVRQGKQEEAGAIDASLQRMAGGNETLLAQFRRETFGPNWSPGGGGSEDGEEVIDLYGVGGS